MQSYELFVRNVNETEEELKHDEKKTLHNRELFYDSITRRGVLSSFFFFFVPYYYNDKII